MTARRRLLLATLAALTTIGIAGIPASAGQQSTPNFDHVRAITIDKHGHLWVNDGNAIEEVGTGGAMYTEIFSQHNDIDDPVALATWEGRVVVVNHGGSVTEFSEQSGHQTRWLHSAAYDFGAPSAIAIFGSTAWVADTGSSAVTEFNLATGTLIRVIHSGLVHPQALATAGQDLWVVDTSNKVVEFSRRTGSLIRTIDAAKYGFAAPRGIAYDGTHLWVTDSESNAVTELTAAGHLVQVITNSSNNSNYGFNAPAAVVAQGGSVYVISPPGASPMITRINEKTADGDWYECNTNTPDPGFANPTALAVNNGRVWVVSPKNSSLAELKVATGALVRRWAD